MDIYFSVLDIRIHQPKYRAGLCAKILKNAKRKTPKMNAKRQDTALVPSHAQVDRANFYVWDLSELLIKFTSTFAVAIPTISASKFRYFTFDFRDLSKSHKGGNRPGILPGILPLK